MTRTKRRRWERNLALERVFDPGIDELRAGTVGLAGCWGSRVFGTQAPISAEFGCGYGDFLVALARVEPERSFVGVDIKSHRFHKYARDAHEQGLGNAAFLRAKIENIEHFFGPAELDEVWLTFSDPQPKDVRGTKRITSPRFFERYSRIVRPDGLVHIKTDSDLLYSRTRSALAEEGYEVTVASDDVHGRLVHEIEERLAMHLSFRTVYESRWIAEGRRIHYLQVRITGPRGERAPRVHVPRAMDRPDARG